MKLISGKPIDQDAQVFTLVKYEHGASFRLDSTGVWVEYQDYDVLPPHLHAHRAATDLRRPLRSRKLTIHHQR